MGLTTVRKIVEEAGGIVCVETDPGKGTRMVVRLPEIAAPKWESHGMKGRDLAGM
jgi:signal transduction histidine kinase